MTSRQKPEGKNSDNRTVAMALFDKDGRLVETGGDFANLTDAALRSVTERQLLGAYLQRFETVQDRACADAVDDIIALWRQPDGIALEARTPEGAWRLLSSSRCAGGGMLYVSIDVDRQKRHRDLAHFMVENTRLPMWVNRVEDGAVLFANPAACRLYGVGEDEREGRFVSEFFHSEHDSIEMRNTLEVKGAIENYPVRTRSASGRDLWVSGCAQLGHVDGQKVVTVAIQDLTERGELANDTLKARDMLRDAIESLSEGFALYDEDGRLVLFNESYRKMNQAVADILQPGLEWEILMRETARRGVYADALGREEEWVYDRVRNGIEYIQDYELKHTDGTHYLVSVHPTKLGGFVVTRTDITAKKQAEAAERDGDLLIRQVLEASPAAVVMARVGDGQILYRSPAAMELFGKVKNERACYTRPDDRADYVTALLADGRVDNYQLTLINAEGEVFPASNYGRLAEYKGEDVVVTTTIDLTRQNEAEALIRQVLEACPVPVQMTNADSGKLLFRSPETIALFGAVDTSAAYYVNPEDRVSYLEKLREKGWINEYRAKFRNVMGGEFWGAVSARLIEFNGEQVIVSNTRDLTEELALQEELSSQREMLFQNEKMSALGELLAGVAHELNNPLSIVVGHSLMLREEARDPETIKRIGKISNAAERCAKIVKTFLAMARQQPRKMENVDINAVISTAIDVAAYGGKGEALRIDCDLAATLPVIVADADQVTQVVINLIINAEQAMAATGKGDRIVVTTALSSSSDAVEICVTDNGPGIPRHIVGRIFEPFFTTKDIGEGTGIGLAFCHRIVHSHGGRIWVDADHRDGSRFCVSLPVADKTADRGEASGQTERKPVDTKVLVVDDETEVAELIAEILQKDGLRVDVAHSGHQALKKLEITRYDLLLSDLNMPELDGRGLYEMVRDKHPDMLERTAFITGDTMGLKSQDLLRQSKRPHLEKPVSPAELRQLVYGILNDKDDS